MKFKKSILKVFGAFLVLVICCSIFWAGVQVKSWYTKQYKVDIAPGQRMIIVDKSYTQVRVYPKEAKIFDTGRLNKRLYGVLTEK